MKDIYFVIRSRNEEDWIGYCIQSIIDTFGPGQNIVVVDNDSEDDSLKRVQMFVKERNKNNIKICNIKKNEYTPGKSINTGISKLKEFKNFNPNNSIVAIISAHCQIKKIDKQRLFNHFKKEKNCFGVVGNQIPVYLGKKVRRQYVWKNFLHKEVQKNTAETEGVHKYFFHNAFSFIDYAIWLDHQFDENWTSKEDRYWAENLVDKNKNFYFDPEIQCIHHWTKNGATWRGYG